LEDGRMSELRDLGVHGETAVGWCAATPPKRMEAKAASLAP
jgi:hypothetical protein